LAHAIARAALQVRAHEPPPSAWPPPTRMAQRPIRVLTVDDHALLREGIAALLSGEPDVEVVGSAATGREAVERFRALHPDVTLMDLQMPEMSGLEAVIAIRAEFPEARIIVLTTYSGDAHVVRALRAGAAGFLLKDMVHRELPDAIRAVHAGRKSLSPEASFELAAHADDEALTPAELEVLRLVATGSANKQIADRLGITEDTVKGRVRSVLSKLNANDRTHAVMIGLRRGLIQLQ
jgi:DNA-binding NarL/FixJ family response regulator